MADAMRRLGLGLTLGVALALGACSEPPPRAQDQWPITPAELGMGGAPADLGALAYSRTCIACHGADGKGNGAKTGADLSAPDGPLSRPDEQLLVSILDGKQGTIGVMPAHRALLSAAEATAVLAYVRRSFGAGIVPHAPDAAAPSEAATQARDAATPDTAPAP